MNIDNIKFHSPTKGALTFGQVTEEVVNIIQEEPNWPYELAVGTDSEKQFSDEKEQTHFAMAIVIRRLRKLNRIFTYHFLEDKKYWTIRDRMIAESILSITLTQELKSRLKDHLKIVSLEDIIWVHSDVGTNGETKTVIREVIGMIRGFGLQVKIKPEAWAASYVADRII